MVEISGLDTELKTPLAHVARLQRQVVVRRNIPVIGEREVDAVQRRDRKMGMQQPRATLAVKREGGDRRIEERHTAKPQRSMLGRTFIVVVIEMGFRRLQIPVFLIRLACRKCIREKGVLVLAFEIDSLGPTIGFGRPLWWRLRRQAVAVRHIEHHWRAGGISSAGDRNYRWRRAVEATTRLLENPVADVLGRANLLI